MRIYIVVLAFLVVTALADESMTETQDKDTPQHKESFKIEASFKEEHEDEHMETKVKENQPETSEAAPKTMENDNSDVKTRDRKSERDELKDASSEKESKKNSKPRSRKSGVKKEDKEESKPDEGNVSVYDVLSPKTDRKESDDRPSKSSSGKSPEPEKTSTNYPHSYQNYPPPFMYQSSPLPQAMPPPWMIPPSIFPGTLLVPSHEQPRANDQSSPPNEEDTGVEEPQHEGEADSGQPKEAASAGLPTEEEKIDKTTNVQQIPRN